MKALLQNGGQYTGGRNRQGGGGYIRVKHTTSGKKHFEGILSSVPIVVNSVCACSSFHLYALTVNVCLGSSQGR